MQDPVGFLKALFKAGLDAADPLKIVPKHLPPPPKGRTVVVGAGKAAASMAKAVEDNWPADKSLQGLVVTQYGYGLPTKRIEVIEAAHPFPDDSAEDAAKKMLALVNGLTSDDLVLALISGGGSSLMSLPAPGISRADKKAVISGLMKAGAPISAINCVRKHVSAIKGGRLALAAHPAPVHTLLISDVPGDVPHIIASGPTLPDPTTRADTGAILRKYLTRLDSEGALFSASLEKIPQSVLTYISEPDHETPKPSDLRINAALAKIIARNMDALNAAAAAARTAGIEPVILGDNIEGIAREVGKTHIEYALRKLGQRPFVLISGGETTVHITGKGKGGRNSEYILGAALHAAGNSQIYGLAAGTDGLDGNGGCAGAFFTPKTLEQAAEKGLNPETYLFDNDTATFFAALDSQIVTGPTRTNVTDLRAILVV